MNKQQKGLNMHLVRLVYASKFAADQYDHSEIAKIFEKSKIKNIKVEISGILVAGEDYFLQCLEGERQSVNSLYEIICKDPRHTNILIMLYEECFARDFGEWSMKYVLLTEKKTKHNSKICSIRCF